MQFSLRMLFAAVALVGIGAALWVAEPSWQVGLVEALILVWVPASAVVLCINSSGKTQAWWIGIAAASFFGTSCFLLVVSGVVNSGLAAYFSPNPLITWRAVIRAFVETLAWGFQMLVLWWAFAPVAGLLCVLTHWLFIRPASAEPKD